MKSYSPWNQLIVNQLIPFRCSAESASDYIEFSNDFSVNRKLPRHCGLRKPKSIISDHDRFRVVFKSNDKFDGTGFKAFYSFREIKSNQFKS